MITSYASSYLCGHGQDRHAQALSQAVCGSCLTKNMCDSLPLWPIQIIQNLGQPLLIFIYIYATTIKYLIYYFIMD